MFVIVIRIEHDFLINININYENYLKEIVNLNYPMTKFSTSIPCQISIYLSTFFVSYYVGFLKNKNKMKY